MNRFDYRDSQSSDEMSSQFGDHVDDATFSQILEMDESKEERDFSKPLVDGFFDQAVETFLKIEEALQAQELEKLSNLGHFLKGSSATLGFNKIRDSCNVIQQYGQGLNVDGTTEPDDRVCLKKIAEALSKVKADTDELAEKMRKFFNVEAEAEAEAEE